MYCPRYGADSVALGSLPQMLADGYLGLVTPEGRRFVEGATGRECGLMPGAG